LLKKIYMFSCYLSFFNLLIFKIFFLFADFLWNNIFVSFLLERLVFYYWFFCGTLLFLLVFLLNNFFASSFAEHFFFVGFFVEHLFSFC